MKIEDCVAGTWVVIYENENTILSYHNRIGYIENISSQYSVKVRFINNDYTLVRSEDLTLVSFEMYGIEDVKVGDNIAIDDGSLGCTVTNII
jgi:pyruvate kinase